MTISQIYYERTRQDSAINTTSVNIEINSNALKQM